MEHGDKRIELRKSMVRIVTIRSTSVKKRIGAGNQNGILFRQSCNPFGQCAILWCLEEKEIMQEKRRVLYKKGVFVCPGCRQSYVQEKWIEEWRIRCHRCTYRGTLTEVSVEEHMEEETFRR